MSDVISPDATTAGSEGAETGGKVSFMEKVKTKARDKTKKLRSKLTPGSQEGGGSVEGSNPGDDSSSASSSDEEKEKEAPVNNAMTGMTQPEFEKKLDAGDPSALAGGAQGTQGSPCVPRTNFPGDHEGTVGEKDTQETELSRDFEGLSTKDEDKSAKPESEPTEEQKPVTEKMSDTFFGAKDQMAEKVDSSSGSAPSSGSAAEAVKPSDETKEKASEYTDKAAGTGSDLAGKASDTAKDVTGTESTEGMKQQTTAAGQSWAQWAADKVGYGKEVAAEKLPKTEDGTSAPDAAIGKAYEAKDLVSQKAGEVTDATSAKAGEYQSSIPSDPAQRTYLQHAATHATTAKDSLMTNTTPGAHDKALSEKVTESIGNLPTMLKSSLGFGGSAPTSPSTGSSITGADAAAPQSPSIVGRFTSMFAEKKPPSSENPAATKDEQSASQ